MIVKVCILEEFEHGTKDRMPVYYKCSSKMTLTKIFQSILNKFLNLMTDIKYLSE